MSGQADRIPSGPLDDLPRLDRRVLDLSRCLRVANLSGRTREALSWLTAPLGEALEIGPVEILGRASGLARPGVIAQMAWPSRGTRLGLGIETTLAHAMVDRLLGHDRRPGEDRLQVTPVEWGILTYVVARSLGAFLGDDAPDLLLDRVGPDPFDPSSLGPILTLRWPLRVGDTTASVRLWLPDGLLSADHSVPASRPVALSPAFLSLTGLWRAEAGRISLPRGLGRLRAGVVLPIDGSPLAGTPASPEGAIWLALPGRDGRTRIPLKPVPLSDGCRLVVTGPLESTPQPREAFRMDPQNPSADPSSAATGEIPVTLTVELGRVSLSVGQVAALKPGDVLELARHSREPVEITSGDRLIARGELVLIESELGVRLTTVFL